VNSPLVRRIGNAVLIAAATAVFLTAAVVLLTFFR
jgi:hypothetical protein